MAARGRLEAGNSIMLASSGTCPQARVDGCNVLGGVKSRKGPTWAQVLSVLHG